MRYPRQDFSDLMEVWHKDTTGHQVEVLVQNLIAQVVKESSLCLGVYPRADLAKFYGLSYFFNIYGFRLLMKPTAQSAKIFVFLDKHEPEHDPRLNGEIIERRLSPSRNLAAS